MRKLIFYFVGILLIFSHWAQANASNKDKTGERILEIINNINPDQICKLNKRADNLLDFNKSSCSQAIVSIHVKRPDVLGKLSERPTLLTGTGVLIAPNLILTNNHIINSKERLEYTTLIADHLSVTDTFSIKPVKLRAILDEESIFFTDPSLDFTIFEIEKTNRPVAYGYSVESRYDLDKTYSISAPDGQNLRYTVPYDGKRTILKDNVIAHYCHSFPGSSGSPLFDAKGFLLGIHRASDVIEGRNTANENYGVSFPSIIKSLSEIDKYYNEKNIAVTNQIRESLESSIQEWSIESVLLGLPPGHEILTVEGIRKSGIESLRYMKSSFIQGNIDVDYPTFFGLLPNFRKIYKSHYGENQFQHAMLTDEMASSPSEKRNEFMHDKLLNYLDKKVEKFIAMYQIDKVQAAREFGQIIHTVQDSYSPSHTKRDEKGVVSFFHYKAQDKENHEKLDEIYDEKDQYTELANLAIQGTSELLLAAYQESKPQKQNIMNVLRDVFKLSSENIKLTSIKEPVSEKAVLDNSQLESSIDAFSMPDLIDQKAASEKPILYKNTIHRPIDGDECCPPPTYE